MIINGIKKDKKVVFGGLLSFGIGINFKPFVNKQNLNTMKKLLVVLAIGAFAACNGSGSSASTQDSTAAKDSAAKMDSSSKMSTDTSKMKMTDTTKKATDTTKK